MSAGDTRVGQSPCHRPFPPFPFSRSQILRPVSQTRDRVGLATLRTAVVLAVDVDDLGDGDDRLTVRARLRVGGPRADRSKLPQTQAVSTGRSNTGLEFTRRSFKAQGFSWALLEA